MPMKLITYTTESLGSKKIASLIDQHGATVVHLYSNPDIDLSRNKKVLLFGQPDVSLSNVQLHEALHQIVAFGRDEAFQEIIGPMEGSTWHSYRTTLFHTGELHPGDINTHKNLRAVLLEGSDEVPALPPFTCIESYASCEMSPAEVAQNLAKNPANHAYQSLCFEAIAAKDFLEKVASLFEMVSLTFSRNQLFSPLGKDEFIALYAPLATLAKDGWLQLATMHKEAVGFVLLLEDTQTFVVKTLGRLPGNALARMGIPSAQLGAAMARQCQELFMASGKQRLVMALMHEKNPSYTWAINNGGRVFARYGLFSTLLD